MPRLTVALAIALACGTTTGVVSTAPPAAAAGEDPVAEWDKTWQTALKDSAGDYAKICKQYEEKLEATAAYTRRRILRFLPDDEETRRFLGYAKARQADGTDKWERIDTRRDELNAMVDLDDPKATKWGKQLADVEKRVATRFKGLALRAKENLAKDPSTDAGWKSKAERAWEKVLECDPDNEQAHKELGHQKFEGKYASPFKLQFLQARANRKRAGEKTNATKPEATACEIDGAMVNAGLTGGGAKSAHIRIDTTHGKDVAVRLAQSVEKGIADLWETYGFPEQIKERPALAKISVIKDREEFKQFLEKGAKWNKAQIQRFIDANFGGTGYAPGEFLTTDSAQIDADDAVMNINTRFASLTVQMAARADLGTSVRDEIEDWLWQSMCYDVTSRVLGTKIMVWGAFGRYGQNVQARPGQDVWIELARRLAEADDDVPLSKLHKMKLENQDFKGPQTVKGYAFLQFVFEKDPELAKKFVWNALANGTPAACAAVYPDNADAPDPEKSMDKIDAEYREWLLKATN